MDIIAWLLVGLVAGALASAVMRGSGFGILGDIVLGIVGAFLGSWVFQQLGWRAPLEGILGVIVVAFVGAVLALALLRVFKGLSRGR